MTPPQGKNAAIMGMGGGASVQFTDDCARAGLDIPPLPAKVRHKLEEIYTTESGSIFRNPVDMYWGKKELIQKAIRTVVDYEGIDLLVMHITLHTSSKHWVSSLGPYIEAIINLGKEINNRAVIVFRLLGEAGSWSFALQARRKLTEAGFPVFPSAARAADALVRFIDHHKRLKALTGK
jgi:acyl-CoA synthetase (NDP forming)